jgi:hypothetical protein
MKTDRNGCADSAHTGIIVDPSLTLLAGTTCKRRDRVEWERVKGDGKSSLIRKQQAGADNRVSAPRVRAENSVGFSLLEDHESGRVCNQDHLILRSCN